MCGKNVPGIELRIGVMALLLLAAAPPTEAPKPTPTPARESRKLSGGFGRGGPDAVVTPANAATPASGQSLAQEVRALERTKRRKATVAITNETLVTDPTKGRLTTSSIPPAAPAPAPTAGPVETRPKPASAEEGGEAYWRERMRAARARVEELKESVRRFEQESGKLENDFYSWDDGQYRDRVIKPAWDRKREELETARRDLEQAQKELSELPEKARRAGAQPGWLRQ